jgi:plasmid stability protein
MATLLVRNLDDGLVQRLKQRAARNGRSVEAEHRALLEQCLGPVDKAEWFARAAELRLSMDPIPDGTSLELLREGRDDR